MTNGPQDVADDARDERLRAALRHAPDGAVAPPQALSATIRAAAHAAVAPGPAPSWRRHWPAWQHAWRALGAPRPIWAGGAAAVLVSVLTINLWIGEPVPSAVESPAPVSVPAPATSAETETALQSTTRAVTDNTAPGAPPPQATGVAAQAPTATAVWPERATAYAAPATVWAALELWAGGPRRHGPAKSWLKARQ